MAVPEKPMQDSRSDAGSARRSKFIHIIALIALITPAGLLIGTLMHRLSVLEDETRRARDAKTEQEKRALDAEEALRGRDQGESARRSAEQRTADQERQTLRAAEAGLAVVDEAARRRNLAAYSQRLSSQPADARHWSEEMRRLAFEAQGTATRLLNQAMILVRQNRHAEAEPLLILAFESLEARIPANTDLKETPALSVRWRVLTALERVYGPSGLKMPLRRDLVEGLARQPAARTSGVLRGATGLFPSSELGGAEAWLNLYGDRSPFRVTEVVGDVTVSPVSGVLPARLRVAAAGIGLHPYGIRIEAGRDVLKATGVLLVADWEVKFFNWNAGSNPRVYEHRWQELIAGKPSAYLKTNSICFTWWDRSPAAGVSADEFGTVATTSVPLSGGRYRIWTSADDGVRVWIDDAKLIDDWLWRPPRENATTLWLNQGVHKIRIEHFEVSQHAQLHFGMEPLD